MPQLPSVAVRSWLSSVLTGVRHRWKILVEAIQKFLGAPSRRMLSIALVCTLAGFLWYACFASRPAPGATATLALEVAGVEFEIAANSVADPGTMVLEFTRVSEIVASDLDGIAQTRKGRGYEKALPKTSRIQKIKILAQPGRVIWLAQSNGDTSIKVMAKARSGRSREAFVELNLAERIEVEGIPAGEAPGKKLQLYPSCQGDGEERSCLVTLIASDAHVETDAEIPVIPVVVNSRASGESITFHSGLMDDSTSPVWSGTIRFEHTKVSKVLEPSNLTIDGGRAGRLRITEIGNNSISLTIRGDDLAIRSTVNKNIMPTRLEVWGVENEFGLIPGIISAVGVLFSGVQIWKQIRDENGST